MLHVKPGSLTFDVGALQPFFCTLSIQDVRRNVRLSEELEYGMVCVNDWLPATPEAPFGGIKQSGLGRESGKEGLYEYMEEKTVFFGGIG